MNIRNRLVQASLFLVVSLITACGGGGEAPAPTAPVISVQPADQTVFAGQDASFSVTATGTSLAYQWQRSTDGGATFSDLAGATGATLTRSAVPIGDNGHRFRVVVSNSAGSATSDAALLTVNAAPAIPVFTLQPSGQSVSAPAAATFNAAATGNPTPTLQWQLSTNGGSSFNDIAGATSGSYTTPATTGLDNGNQYRLVATNASGSTNSNAATLSVTVPAAPVFTQHPQNVSVVEGQSTQMTVSLTGTPTPTLQWQLSTDSGVNWSDIVGATGTVFNIIGPALANNGRQFRAVASNSEGVVNSNAATLTVNANIAPVAVDDTANTTMDSALNIAAATLIANDSDANGSSLTLTAVQNPLNGTVLLSAGNVTFTPTTGFTGTASFEYTVSDGALFDTGLVSITVTAAQQMSSIVFDRWFGISSADDVVLIKEDGTGEIALATTADQEQTLGIAPGGRVVYMRSTGGQNNIYSVNADASGTLPLAQSVATFHGITPDGWVIYRTDTPSGGRDIHAVRADGTGTAILANTSGNEDFGTITASGRIIFQVAVAGGQTDVYSINADGTGGVALAGLTTHYEGFQGASSAGLIVFYRCDLSFFVCSMYSINESGGMATELAVGNEYSFAGFTSTGQVVINRQPGAGLRDIYINGTTVALANSIDFEMYQGSTADGRVIYSRETPIPGTGSFQRDLHIVNADGTNTLALGDSPDFHEDFNTVAPDGRIIYGRTSVANGLSDLYAVNANGTGAVALANSATFQEFFAGITASGRVVYNRENGSLNSLYAVNTDGTGTTLLPGGSFFVATTPGNKVLIRNQDNGNANLYIVNADGTGSIPLATTGNNEFFGAAFQ